jgi:hypothetical protein
MACIGESSSGKEKADWAGETRPLSRFLTLNIFPCGVGKSLAVGVVARKDTGETLPSRMGEVRPVLMGDGILGIMGAQSIAPGRPREGQHECRSLKDKLGQCIL